VTVAADRVASTLPVLEFWLAAKDPTMIEFTLLAIVFAGVFAQPSLREVFRAAPRANRIAAASVLTATLAGQLVADAYATYPFVDWAMYTNPVEDDPSFYLVTLRGPDGQDERAPIESLFPGASYGLRIRVHKLATRMEALPPGADRDAATARLNATLGAIGDARRRALPTAPMEILRLSHCLVPMQTDGSAGAPECRVVVDIDLGAR